MSSSRKPIPKLEIRNPTSEIPDRGHLSTEQRNPASAGIDALTTEDALRVINDADATIAAVVRWAIPTIAKVVDAAVTGIRAGGRLVYLGAGTSGRLGVLDASECPPTFHCPPEQVVGIIAGGDSALRRSGELAEDDPDGAREELERLKINEHDTVIGIAAGGTTPYVLGALAIAHARGAVTALMTCVPLSSLKSQASRLTPHHVVELPVGPEVVTGSTRLKAGTATKLALNMISSAVMIRLGKTWGNLMVDLKASNAKLRDRAARIITSQCDLSRDEALTLLDRADGRVKLALVMARKNVGVDEAQQILDEHGGMLRAVLGAPR